MLLQQTQSSDGTANYISDDVTVNDVRPNDNV